MVDSSSTEVLERPHAPQDVEISPVEKTPIQLAISWLEAAAGYYRQKLQAEPKDQELTRHYEEQAGGYEGALKELSLPEDEGNVIKRAEMIAKYSEAEKVRQTSIEKQKVDPIASQVQVIKPY